MRIKELLQKIKNILPFIAIGLSWDSHSMASEARAHRLNQITTEVHRLTNELKTTQEIIKDHLVEQGRIATLSADAADHIDSATRYSKVIDELAKKLNDPNLDEAQRSFITRSIEIHTNLGMNSIEQANSTVKSIIDSITPNKSGIDLMDQFNVLLTKYKEFLTTLTVEQLAILTNLLGFIIVLSSSISIIAVLYGDLLINFFNKYFQIDSKYPKIASFLKARRKFQWYYLNYNLITIIVFSLFLIYFNIKNF